MYYPPDLVVNAYIPREEHGLLSMRHIKTGQGDKRRGHEKPPDSFTYCRRSSRMSGQTQVR